jgi:uncharacterized protein YbaP (TraB family)
MSLRRAALVCALLVAGSAPLFAEGPASAQPPTAVAPFLWQVQGPKVRHYLLGSVHLLPPSSRPLPAALDAAYASTAALVVETDLAALTSPEIQARMTELAREDKPGGLKARVGKKLYRKVQKRAHELGISTEEFCATWRAWFCALTLELYPLQLAQFSPEFGVDNEYFNRAREDGRPVISLETPAFQIDLFAQMPDALAREMLAATLDEKTYESQTPEELYRMWRAGDLALLARVVEQLRRDYPKLYARILADRSRAWAGPLAERLNQDVPLMVIVGAAHLPGPDGLLALLKARGLEPAPVTAVVENPAPVSRE